MVYQFHVHSSGRLNMLMFQRSGDVLLGLPFNFVGAAALQAMVAQQTGLVPGEFVWMGGDVHLYLNHLDQAREQMRRTPKPLPTLALARRPDSIDGYRIEDFEVAGYDSHPAIVADVAV
jgi:thymidylate synthase